HGAELWRSDGTAEGTVLVRDINPGAAGPGLAWFTVLGSRLFFTAGVPDTGRELWASDGTLAGTVLVHDILPGPAGSDPQFLTAVGARLLFPADDGVHGRELWVLAPERVESVGLDDGSAQRSRVTSVTVTFSGAVSLDPGAFELVRQGSGAIGLQV